MCVSYKLLYNPSPTKRQEYSLKETQYKKKLPVQIPPRSSGLPHAVKEAVNKKTILEQRQIKVPPRLEIN